MLNEMYRRWLPLLALAGCEFSLAPGSSDAPTGIDAPVADAPPDTRPADPCRAVEVAANSGHTCARMENGDLWCWGKNGQGEIGVAPQMSCASNVACNPTASKITLPPVARLGLGDQHTCAITGADTYCWGANDSGQFGNNGGDVSTPLLIPQRAGALAIAAGDTHSCSLHAGGFVRCSGDNIQGQVGDGSGQPRPMPVITVNGGASAIGSGYQHVCAISNGLVQCWGRNADQQIDQGAGSAPLPRTVVGFSGAIAVAAGYDFTCALLFGGDLRCWGKNSSGQLGIGTTTAQTTVVTPSALGIVEIGAGVSHACARAAGGTVFCWGENYSPTPTVVPLPRPAVSIAVGSYHECFALDDGSVWCRGWNAYGQRGLGTLAGNITDPPTRATLCP
jgi:alpha-tubulin suppressor-like RCC1 family protein